MERSFVLQMVVRTGSSNSTTSYWLSNVSFVDSNNGIVVGYGGIILRTTDAGENWITKQVEQRGTLMELIL